MQRPNYLSQLYQWKNSTQRKPLIIKGARQVGKTYLMLEFANSAYSNYVYLNFEYDTTLFELFKARLDPQTILAQLALYFDTNIEPENTLIIFDEIQNCPQALNSLKYFQEEANDYHVIAAGSLLGILMRQSQSFPVGKVNFMTLLPLTFLEFIQAVHSDRLYQHLTQITGDDAIADPIHQSLIQYLKTYLIVGGMPEAVANWLERGSYQAVRQVQHDVLQAYELDFAKHASPHEAMKIKQIWDSLPRQLAKENKKFIFSAVRKSARSRHYESALNWLDSAHLIHKAYRINTPKQPLQAYTDPEAFKVYALDVGLLSAQCQIEPKLILHNEAVFQQYKGALTENFVAQMLFPNTNLYYWTSPGQAEVDFLLNQQQNIMPVEVKAAYDRKTKSLRAYQAKYQPNRLIRLTLRNIQQDAIENYPLYLAERITDL